MKVSWKTVALGGLAGGVVLFVWGAISWMVLPWHERSFKKFTQEYVVEVVLASNAPQKGVYLVPSPHQGTPEERKRSKEKAAKGPFAFVVMNPQGWGSMRVHLVLGLVTQILGAALVTVLLGMGRSLKYGEKVIFVLIFGLAAGVVAHLPNWNWWGFPDRFTLLAFADLLIGWLLAGLVLARIAR